MFRQAFPVPKKPPLEEADIELFEGYSSNDCLTSLVMIRKVLSVEATKFLLFEERMEEL